MKIKSRTGLTLIELMLAIAASAIVILATGIIVVFGQTTWNDTWKKANLQRDASYAMQRITQSIKQATSAEVPEDADGTVLNLVVDGSDITFTFDQGTNDLEYDAGGISEVVIDGKVNNLHFDLQGDTVEIILVLVEDNVETHFESTVMMRNTGGG